jgi:hypothetical protein
MALLGEQVTHQDQRAVIDQVSDEAQLPLRVQEF